MIRRSFALAVLFLLAAGSVPAAGGEATTYHLVHGFSAAPSSTGSITCSTVKAGARPDDATRLQYRIPEKGMALISFPDGVRPIPAPGTLRMWVKGDNSGNQIQLRLKHSNRREVQLRWHTLDFNGWRDLSWGVAPIRGKPPMWLSGVMIRRPGADKGKQEGDIVLDNARLHPSGRAAPSSMALRLVGPDIRPFATSFFLNLEVTYFGADTTTATVHINITDHNDNEVMDHDFDDVTVARGESREVTLEAKPENVHLFLPPFRLQGEVFSPDMEKIKIDRTIVMSNSRLLFEDFSNVFGRWLVSGMGFSMQHDGWNSQHFGEMYRAWARTQTNARISRVEVKKAGAAGGKTPPGRYAMQIDYAGRTMVYNGIHRFLPGDAYRMGVWVYGDGSGAMLHALVFDFSAPGHTMYTWKRHFGIRTLCKLDFKGWRYVEVPLPGNGIGPRTMGGSTENVIDFPLDLSAFAIVPDRKGPSSGSVRIGPIFLHTQQRRDEAISVQLGYDDPNHEYAANHAAWATVQNGWRINSRSVNLNWSLLDRENSLLARGRQALELEPKALSTVRIDLAPHKAKIAGAPGPLRLRAVAMDTREAASAETEIILSKPDSVALISDFETDRGYLGLAASGVAPGPPPGQSIADTTAEQKHSGKRSLAIRWINGQLRPISIDPPMPGMPTSISMWVHGDGSNVLFYPLIGDIFGVVSGVETSQWDLFLPRSMKGELQNAVKVDWKGWREVTFRLPVIPPSWNKTDRVLPFVPSYPFGLHLTVQSQKDSPGAGVIYVDDIRVKTHLKPEARLTMALERLGETNLVTPGGAVRVVVSNMEAPGGAATPPRKALVSGGLYNWRGERIVGVDKQVQLAAGKSQYITIAPKVVVGAYALRIDLTEGEDVITSIAEDLVVADAPSVLGAQWQGGLGDTAKLRLPLRDRFAFLRHDWDWAEFQPGNLQVQTMLGLAAAIRNTQREPYVLLGYSAYWATGEGFEDMLKGGLPPRDDRGLGGRDWGHAVDTFHTPERMDDWENYVMGMMRLAGRDVAGWILWNTPDGSTSLGVEPPQFAEMIKLTDKWRRRYCPDTPLILGGLSRATALPYLWKVKEGLWEIKKDEWWEQNGDEFWGRRKQEFWKRKKAELLDDKYKELLQRKQDELWEQKREEVWLQKKDEMGLKDGKMKAYELKQLKDQTLARLGDETLAKLKDEALAVLDDQSLQKLKDEALVRLKEEFSALEKRPLAELDEDDRKRLRDEAVGELKPDVVKQMKDEAIDHFTGVNLRIDAGRISPEDGQLPEYIDEVRTVLRVGDDGEKGVLLTDLDWAVERAGQGLDAFDQAAFLVRATLLLDLQDVYPTLVLHNEDADRLGFGLIYKKVLTIPPLIQKLPAFQFKPVWWAMVRAKDFLTKAKVVDEIAVQDVVAGWTRCLLYERRGDRKRIAVIWRNNVGGGLSFARTGIKVESAEDIFGAPVPVKDGWYSIGKTPCVFTLAATAEPAAEALTRLHVREGSQQSWPQDVIAAFTYNTGKRQKYAQTGGKKTEFAGRTTGGVRQVWLGLEFMEGGIERFEVEVPADAGLVLRKRFFLGEMPKQDEKGQIVRAGDPHGPGQEAEVIVNGKLYGKWDLKRVEKDLSGGLREAAFVIDKSALAGKKSATIEIRYTGVANTAGWVVLAYREGEVPLSAVGAFHADSTVTSPRVARNVVGLEMRIGKQAYRNGIAVFAPCLMEYPLNGQFKRFTADVGIDSATQGRGSVVFEIQGDGKKLWKSTVVSGLDEAKTVDVDVEKVKRLRLIVTDGGDGNKLDAANWGSATLHR